MFFVAKEFNSFQSIYVFVIVLFKIRLINSSIYWREDKLNLNLLLRRLLCPDLPPLTVRFTVSRFISRSHGLTCKSHGFPTWYGYLFCAVQRLTFLLMYAFSCHLGAFEQFSYRFPSWYEVLFSLAERMGRARFTSFWCVAKYNSCSVF